MFWSHGMPPTDRMFHLLSQIWNSKAHRKRGKAKQQRLSASQYFYSFNVQHYVDQNPRGSHW